MTKQLRNRCVGKETKSKPEPKMSLRSRNPVVKLTRLEDENKIAYEVKTEEDTTPAVKPEEPKRSKRNLPPVEYVKNKRRKQEVKLEVEEKETKPLSKGDKTPKKLKNEEVKIKSEEKVEKTKSKPNETSKPAAVVVTPDTKQSEETGGTKRGARQSERAKKQKIEEGWEEDLYAFKRSLRMPASLIKITRPPGWPKPRSSASLPDLDSRSASPLTCDSFDMKPEPQEGNHKTSFLNQLAQRYGATKKGNKKKTTEATAMGQKCKIIPQAGDIRKLLTPRLDDVPGHRLRRDTIRRVFGDDRPGSAPPATATPTPEPLAKPEPLPDTPPGKKKKKEHVKIKKKQSPVSRTGLRSATKLRSNKVLLQRQRIQKKRRSSQSNQNKAQNLGQNCPQNKQNTLVPRKLIKMRTMRRKFRSSGFDYIRKKKKKEKEKHGKKQDLGEDLHKKIRMTTQSLGDTIEDVGVEIRSWVINKHHGETPLHRAARLGYIDAVAYCLEKLPYGPAPKDNAGYTPLHEAASHGWLHIARLLLMYGADPSDSAIGGIRPLHDAAEKGCVEMVRLLLSYGADPLLASYAGHTPLSITSDDTTRQLLEYHLADVRGHQAPAWSFGGPANCFDKQDGVGYEPLAKVHTKHLEPAPDLSDVIVELSDSLPPHLYVIRTEPQTERWVLFSDIQSYLKPPRTKDSLAKSLGQPVATLYREMKPFEFQEMVQCTSLGEMLPNVTPKPHKITLVKYGEELRRLLRIDAVPVPTI
uniref:BCL-6 corepressor n=1 Tax=Cacopsylla melanoneura TaxID=428564 RepID=A0A8D8YD99_9HEMI